MSSTWSPPSSRRASADGWTPTPRAASSSRPPVRRAPRPHCARRRSARLAREGVAEGDVHADRAVRLDALAEEFPQRAGDRVATRMADGRLGRSGGRLAADGLGHVHVDPWERDLDLLEQLERDPLE